MKKYFLPLPVLFILLFPFLVSAQTDKKKYNASFREFSLRTSLTSYFDFDAGIMLGANYRWSERLSASIEPTWIFYDAFNSAREYKNFPSGILNKAEMKARIFLLQLNYIINIQNLTKKTCLASIAKTVNVLFIKMLFIRILKTKSGD
jgi:hypothetical protein